MKIDPATRDDVLRVANAMRDDDFEEFMAVSAAQDRIELAAGLAHHYGDRHDVLCGRWCDKPVCIGGFVMARPNVITLLFFATDDFPHIGLGITRFIRRNLFPKLERQGVHRFEAVSLATHEQAHAWLRTLGLTPETGPMAGYGKNGETFIQFARVVDA